MLYKTHKFTRPRRRQYSAHGLLALPLIVATSVARADLDECVTSDLPSIESVQSLEKVFDEVARRGDGEIIRADLTAQGVGDLCIWVYKIKLLSGSGDVTNVVYDASALRMIGYGAPSALVEKPKPRGLRGIGQRFGFFGRRDPSSEGRGDSNRDDGVASSSSGDDNAATDGTDGTAAGDNANGDGSATADNGNTTDSGGAVNGDDPRGASGDGGASTGDNANQNAPKD